MRGKADWVGLGSFGRGEVVIWDYGKGRSVRASSCTLTASPTLPPEDEAWEIFEQLEGLVDTELEPGWQISRLDLARDMVVAGSVGMLTDAARSMAWSGKPAQIYLNWPRSLGLTGFPEGTDLIRVYHKGAETAKSHRMPRIPRDLREVVRVEVQLRKGQIPEEIRTRIRGSDTDRCQDSVVRTLRKARLRPDPSEDNPKPRLGPALPGLMTRLVDDWLDANGMRAMVPTLSRNPTAPWKPRTV